MRPATWIEPGKLIAGRHPCAWSPADAEAEVASLLEQGVTLFVDLTQEGELPPYAQHVSAPARHLRIPVRDFTVPAREQIVTALEAIDHEIETGGIVFVHCWAGCGRTGVIVGCWLVRHGFSPHEALARIAETRGLGCPQTLEQRLAILDSRDERRSASGTP
jgi:protein-tyrosine phosphatase